MCRTAGTGRGNGMSDIIENVRALLPLLGFFWAGFILLCIFFPQRLFNSFWLLMTLAATMVGIAALFGEHAPLVLLIAAGLILMGMLMVPALLICNGVSMIRREGRSLANLLSLLLGIFVGLGEIALLVMMILLYLGGVQRGVTLLLLFIGMTVFYFSALILTFVVYVVFMQFLPHLLRYDYIVIHGCGLIDGERVSRLLANRVDKAVKLYRRNQKSAYLVPSGGKGGDEKISEAQAMKNYLLEKGIPEDRILMEDQSTTTEENLRYSKKLIDGREGRKRIALVTSNYHVYRCLLLARKLKIRCAGVGAKVASYYWPSAVIREFVAVFSQKRYLILTGIGYFIFVFLPMVYFIYG